MMIERNTYIEFDNSNEPTIDYLTGIMEDARVTTLQRVSKIETKELHWQFAEGWNTIGALLSHIIADENFFRIYFIEGRELTSEENEKWLPGLEMGKYIPQLITNQPIEYYLSALDESRKQMLKKINQLSAEEFHKRRDGYNPKTGYNLAWALYHAAEDEAKAAVLQTRAGRNRTALHVHPIPSLAGTGNRTAWRTGLRRGAFEPFRTSRD